VSKPQDHRRKRRKRRSRWRRRRRGRRRRRRRRGLLPKNSGESKGKQERHHRWNNLGVDSLR
jgi:hypothetical protein